MTIEEQCLAYLKNHFMTFSHPDAPTMTTEDKEAKWLEMPDDHKKMIVDMILGFSKTGHPAFAEILEQRKKNHSDMSFGMIIKGILSKYKL